MATENEFELEGIVNKVYKNLTTDKGKSPPLNIEVMQKGGQKGYITAWKTMKEKFLSLIEAGDHILIQTKDRKNDEFKTIKEGYEVFVYNIRSDSLIKCLTLIFCFLETAHKRESSHSRTL